jgi:alpha-L-fucosidase 2
MKQTALIFFLHLQLSCVIANGQKAQGQDLKLWYNKPASIWEEALPLGNAKTGAMVFGGIVTERFQLNDNTLWSGSPNPGNNPEGSEILSQVRAQLFAGNWDSATTLWKKMHGPYSARYLPLADLWIKNHLKDSVATSYRRELDLNTAVATVQYTIGDISYKRETFTSYPDKIMVIRITANKKGALNFAVAVTSKLKFLSDAIADDQLLLKGKAPKFVANRDYEPKQVEYDGWEGEGMNFQVHIKLLNEGGDIKKTGNELIVSNADAVTIYLSEATSFNGFNRSPGFDGKDPAIEAKANLGKAVARSFIQLKSRHMADHQSLFNRVKLDLGGNAKSKLPTDERLRGFVSDPTDNHLVTLYYQFGRYLLIAGSRSGSRPTNLQGIWNDHVQPPWGSNYTTNINTEMNYWLAENTNLSECHQPLFDFMKELAVNGSVTAQTNYKIRQGWVVHHNSDLWAKTSPPGGVGWYDPKAMPRWSAWPMAAGWFSTHLWEHYLFTGDKRFLKEEAYPLMKGAAQFLLHWLVADPASGYLVTNPSTSPENTVKINGKEHQLSIASTMDMSIIRELFTETISACDVLKMDTAFRNELLQAKNKLYPFHIGQYGQLQEWFKDWDDPKDKHRHLSHLFGLYPGNEITLGSTPELAAAAKQSLLHRGDVSTGWSMAWKINWWARLHDGEHAYKILTSAFAYIDPREKRETMGGGGTYPNLFDAHPPFQIDGNYGATAGITEMLLQSHDGAITLLPALPSAWKSGSIQGIKARGNFTIGIEWKNGRLARAKVYSALGGNCRIRTYQPVKVVEVRFFAPSGNNSNPLNTAYGKPPYKKDANAKLQELDIRKEYIIDFKTEKGKTYTIVPL